ncbi:23S rRNA (pseudouridine(1915)-N(3))-methyltransferase RlmH [Segetibacter sp.]|jgi:23S rRNA (pseudouridine1915-N3)-methyltransferase|uniref:23S rRNA (pseudouridine(1915)-N(3))-methyltransferase RlmH n=1 Tax=Segetibacter sp. TaxID=2231182 RepID=UPI00260A4221|nr:23S rRNA (pseudouridine(1915)-N(3))-methyltransferase RlmH [Segetibacter sp.]MCW3081574.1 Ribosomal large subunit methyltransferase [Segetibacter sp.]
MKIQLWSVGKGHESYVKEGIEDFTKRISKYYPVEWRILAAAKQTIHSVENDIKKNEAQSVLNGLQKDDYLVLLDEKGKHINSPQVAAMIEARANNSIKNVVFLIGGAFGVDEQIKTRANFIWSFSPLVFPHQLVRLMLAEQIYRACTIIRNEKYHHE